MSLLLQTWVAEPPPEPLGKSKAVLKPKDDYERKKNILYGFARVRANIVSSTPLLLQYNFFIIVLLVIVSHSLC